MKNPHMIARIRHFRGHGIHSPFVYSLKREVFMGKYRVMENNPQYNALIANGVPKKVAKELQKLHNYCNFRSIEIVNSENKLHDIAANVLYVSTDKFRKSAMILLGENDKIAVAVVSARREQANCNCVTIWRRRYTLYIKDSRLQSQLFKL